MNNDFMNVLESLKDGHLCDDCKLKRTYVGVGDIPHVRWLCDSCMTKWIRKLFQER
jgi:hypothetical protein